MWCLIRMLNVLLSKKKKKKTKKNPSFCTKKTKKMFQRSVFVYGKNVKKKRRKCKSSNEGQLILISPAEGAVL